MFFRIVIVCRRSIVSAWTRSCLMKSWSVRILSLTQKCVFRISNTMATFARKFGSRSEVYDLQTAEQTRGGLTKDMLTLSRTGKIVSKKKSEAAKTMYKKWGFKKREEAKEATEATTEDEKPKKVRARRRKKKQSFHSPQRNFFMNFPMNLSIILP